MVELINTDEYHALLTGKDIVERIGTKKRKFYVNLKENTEYKFIGFQLYGKMEAFIKQDEKLLLIFHKTATEFAKQINFEKHIIIKNPTKSKLTISGYGEFTPVIYEVKSSAAK